MTATLKQMLDDTRERVRGLEPRAGELEAAARAAPPAPDWGAVLAGPDVAVIAEVKRRSPSAGAIAPDLEPARLAAEYERGGARAVSVLTDEVHFGGSLGDLEEVRGAVALPVLRKDFIVAPIQLYEARAAGASAVLLIVRALEDAELAELSETALELGLGRLVEVHGAGELERALALDPESVGVNSRDLDTFRVDLAAIEATLREVPSGITAVAESGLGCREDVVRVAEWGADAVLVGTALAGAPDPGRAVSDLTGVERRGRDA
ncbi:MAG: indole-3-glycerol phosphate synthase TrpC [Gemmatimonadales bacterium]